MNMMSEQIEVHPENAVEETVAIAFEKCVSCGDSLVRVAFWLPKFDGNVCLKCFGKAMAEMEEEEAR